LWGVIKLPKNFYDKGLHFQNDGCMILSLIKKAEESGVVTMKMNLTELAELAHVDEARVADYVDNGLLGSDHSTTEFDESDLYWIDMIQCFQDNGTSLSDLSGLMPRCRQAQSKMTQV